MIPEVPKLPTDNLYKFMAITGLVLFIVSPGYWLAIHSKATPLIKAQNEERKAELALADALTNPIYAATTTNTFFRKDGLLEVRGRIVRTLQTNVPDAQRAMTNTVQNLQQALEKADVQAVIYFEHTRVAKLVALGTMGLGALLMGVGFSLWYVRVQKPLDLILAKKGESPPTIDKEMD